MNASRNVRIRLLRGRFTGLVDDINMFCEGRKILDIKMSFEGDSGQAVIVYQEEKKEDGKNL